MAINFTFPKTSGYTFENIADVVDFAAIDATINLGSVSASGFTGSGLFNGVSASLVVTGTNLVYGLIGGENYITGGTLDTVTVTVGGDVITMTNLDIDMSVFSLIVYNDENGTAPLGMENYLMSRTWNIELSNANDIAPFNAQIGDGADFNLTGNDTIKAFGGKDFIFSGDGNDLVLGGLGNDTLLGGNGADTLKGGNGADVLQGGGFKDLLEGGGGNDTLQGQAGNDTMKGGGGKDFLVGGAGADKVDGGAGNDSIQGNDGNDNLSGGNLNDRISGGKGFDKLFGGNGDDELIGDKGNDSLYGGNGSDTLNGGQGNDKIWFGGGVFDQANGGAGADTFFFTDVSGGRGISDFDSAEGDKLNFKGVSSINAFSDLIDGVNMVTSGGNTTITISAVNQTIVLYGGEDLSASDFIF
jgi:Ca2+-binding RTX toxin-like protein